MRNLRIFVKQKERPRTAIVVKPKTPKNGCNSPYSTNLICKQEPTVARAAQNFKPQQDQTTSLQSPLNIFQKLSATSNPKSSALNPESQTLTLNPKPQTPISGSRLSMSWQGRRSPRSFPANMALAPLIKKDAVLGH